MAVDPTIPRALMSQADSRFVMPQRWVDLILTAAVVGMAIYDPASWLTQLFASVIATVVIVGWLSEWRRSRN
jgi:hypothetical protein